MKRIGLLFLMMAILSMAGWANNVRIKGDVKVSPDDVDVTTGVATIRFTVQWDNSWRDAFNYDGVYLFFKYKVDGEAEKWHHAYLMSNGCVSKTTGYKVTMANSSGANNMCEGLFINREEKGFGDPEVQLELKWLITSNGDRNLTRDDFVAGNVFLSAMGIEMVHVPRGAFRIGDTKSEYTFKNNDVTIPAGKDILTDKKFIYSSSCQVDSTTKGKNPPEFAVNRINSPGNTSVNAWVGCTKSGEAKDYWMVDFGEGNQKQIFNIAIESIEGGTPTSWSLEGMNGTGGTWTELYGPGTKGNNGAPQGGNASDWAINSTRTYPCTHAIEIPKTTTAYRYFRINILATNQPVVIKNIAMTTENIFDKVDNSVLVYKPQSEMSPRMGLYAADSDTWSGTTKITYPNGYSAFWAMKYEVSQEQYVSFLNKLSVDQQRTRTVGPELERLNEGDYVFGPWKSKPSARNGVKLASIGVNGQPHVFANDLDATNDYAQDGDGQTLACNFLNAGDMLAYADWCGLRPLSEMEFEKMGRRPFPEAALWNEYAWNSGLDFVASTKLDPLTKGTKSEKPIDGNVNAEGKIGGPIRCGAYAAMGGRQVASGGSFWGLMELSGNLAELYYNANTEGRVFCANEERHHGNGKLLDGGATDVSASFWPVHEQAFALRGGSYKSAKAQTALSDRSRHWGIYATVNEISTLRDSTVTFRLGRTAAVLSEKGEVTLQNGLTSANSAPIDTVCSGDGYVINGTVPATIKGAYRVAWFVSEDLGTTWDLIVGQEEPTLKLANLRNLNEATNFFKEYQYERRIYSNGVDVTMSRPVQIRVVDHQILLSRYRDTVDIYDHSNGIQITSKQQATFKWYWLRANSGNVELTDIEYPQLTAGIAQLNFLKYSDFKDVAVGKSEDVQVMIETKVLNVCTKRDTIQIHVVQEPRKSQNVLGNGDINTAFACGDILIDNEAEGDNELYTTVKIGDRCWMAQNLRRKHQTGVSKCYTGMDAQSNCGVYGRLYNWVAATGNNATNGVKGICPKGWHLPTNAEWTTLWANVGSDVKNIKVSQNDWTYSAAKLGNNESRFSALPGGREFRYNAITGSTMAGIVPANGFIDKSARAWWWTSTIESGTRQWASEYYAWYHNYNTVTGIPYYIRLDNAGNMVFNETTSWGCRWGTGYYLANSVFVSGVGLNAPYGNDNNSTWNLMAPNNDNTAALTRMRNEFYMSVRCIKD